MTIQIKTRTKELISSQVKCGWMHFNINIKKPFWLPGQWWVWIDLFAKQFVNILIISARCQRLDATNSTGWSVKKCCTGLEAGKSDKQKRAGGKPFNLADWLEITGPSLTRRVGKKHSFYCSDQVPSLLRDVWMKFLPSFASPTEQPWFKPLLFMKDIERNVCL